MNHKWLSVQAAAHKHAAKTVRNKKKRAIHRQKYECYQMAMNFYEQYIDLERITRIFGIEIICD